MAKARWSFALPIAALAIFALLTAQNLYADSNARIVRLSDVEGSVQIDRNTGHGFEKAIQNMPITQGVRLETGMTGRAEVEFENGSVLRLAGDSSVQFSNLTLRSNGDQVNEVRVNDGTVYANFRRKGDTDFRLWVGNRPLDLEKDVRLRLRVDRSEAQIAVFKGEVKIQGASESAKVKKNETLTLDLADGSRYNLAKGISRYPADDYDEERNQYLDQYASTRTYGNSPYAYGYSDLNRYGSFFDVPGYGMVWRPVGVGLGWDPYGDGYWSFYPGNGYVWVSGYQWGWTPYRFGSWLFVPSYGWCWRPGYWNRWNTGVSVVNPPAGWRNPTPPPPGGGTTVIVGQPRTPRIPRKIEVEDMGLRPDGRRKPAIVTVPGQPTGAPATGVSIQGGTTTPPAPAAPVVSQPSPVQPSTAGRVEPTRPTKMTRDFEGDAPEVRRGTQRSPQQVQPPNTTPAPSRQMSAPPSPPQAPRAAPATPAPAPKMQSAPPPIRSSPPPMHSGGKESRTSPR